MFFRTSAEVRARKSKQSREYRARLKADPERVAKARAARRAQIAAWRAKNPEKEREYRKIAYARRKADPVKYARLKAQIAAAVVRRRARLKRERGMTQARGHLLAGWGLVPPLCEP